MTGRKKHENFFFKVPGPEKAKGRKGGGFFFLIVCSLRRMLKSTQSLALKLRVPRALINGLFFLLFCVIFNSIRCFWGP